MGGQAQHFREGRDLMKDVWYVVYESCYNSDSPDPIITNFVGGFVDEKDAKAFLKMKKREKADSIRKGWTSFSIQVRPLFE